MFNALKYTKKLEEVGFTREQAEAHAFMMMETIESSLATKQDFKGLRGEMKDLSIELRAELKDLSVELRNEMKDLKTELKGEMKDLRNEMKQLEQRLTIKLGTIVSIAIGIAVALAKTI